MNREVLVGVVGVPTPVSRDFDPKFARLSAQVRVHHVLTLSMAPTEPYDAVFAEDVFRRLADKLKKRDTRSHDLLSDTNVVLLYMNKRGSDALLKSLGIETLPMAWYPPGDLPGTPRERRRYVNGLIDDARTAIRHAKDLLGVIKKEVTNRDRKTCLLLPPKTFGRHMDRVTSVVHEGVRRRSAVQSFADDIRQLKLDRRDGCFVGRGGTVFRAPPKARARHGLAPTWETHHPARCVVRGRLRFGVSYDPRFHYDCERPKGRSGQWQLPGCHEPTALPAGRQHANVAPNDAAR